MAPYIEAIDSQKSSYFVVSYNFFQLFDRLQVNSYTIVIGFSFRHNLCK